MFSHSQKKNYNHRLVFAWLFTFFAILFFVVQQPAFGTPPAGDDNGQEDQATPGTSSESDAYNPLLNPYVCSVNCQTLNVEDRKAACTIVRPEATDEPVYLRHGAALETNVDIRVSAPGISWKLARSYTHDATGSTSNGNKWFSDGSNTKLIQDGNNIELLQNIVSKVIFTSSNGSPPFTTPGWSSLQLDHDTTNDQYVLTDLVTMTRQTFHDFTVTPTVEQGRLKEQSTLQWVSEGKTGVEFDYDSYGKVSTITSAGDQAYSINYSYSGDNISKVEVKDGTDIIQKVEYTYYEDVTSPSSDIGSTGDLVQVKVSKPAHDDTSSLSIVGYAQYRYDSSSRLKAVYHHSEIYQIIDALSGITTPEDILTKADTYGTTTDLEEYASKSFEYYSSATSTSSITTTFGASENLNSTYGGIELDETDMVKSETIGGGCASCGSSSVESKRSYYYLQIGQGATLDHNEVTRLVIEDIEDSTGTANHRVIYGLNDDGMMLRKAIIKDPTGTPSYWCHSKKLSSSNAYQLAEARKPSAHDVTSATDLKNFLDPYDSEGNSWSNDTNTLQSNDGYIMLYSYNSAGMITDTKIKKGSSGTAYFFGARDYGDGDGDSTGDDASDNSLVVASYSYPTKTTTRTDGKKTTYSYTFWDSDDRQIKKKITTLPAIPTSQNGSNVAITTEEYYDEYGRLRWTKDGEGFVSYYAHHPITGGVTYQVSDVDPSSPGTAVTSGSTDEWDAWTVASASTNKPTRGSGLPTALAAVSKTYYNDKGEVDYTVDPTGAVKYELKENDRQIVISHWDSSSGKALIPVQVTEYNDQGNVTESYTIRADYSSFSTSGGAPTGFSTEPSQSDYISWTRNTYDSVNDRLLYVDTYHDIPSSGSGTLSTNFNRRISKYDAFGRQEYAIQVVSGSAASDRKEQVVKTVFDFLGRVIETKQGVSGDSAANSHNMTDDYDTYPTLYTTSKKIYDDDGVGDGFVTKELKYFDTGTNDYTGMRYKYTYRGDVRGVESFYMNGSTETTVAPYTVSDVNWQGKVTAVAQYDTAPTWSSVLTGDGLTDYADSTSTNRISLSTTDYDYFGRVYQKRAYKIDPDNGTGSDYFDHQFYFNRNGQKVAESHSNSGVSETAYDGVGRAYQQRQVLALESTKYSSGEFQYRDPQPHPNLSSMTGGDDQVLIISHSEYDDFNMTGAHGLEINHDDVTGANIGIDLTNNNDYVRKTKYMWHDSLGRMTTTANYGSGDTAAGSGTWKYTSVPTRPSTAPSTSSNTALVSTFAYNSETGQQETITGPDGVVSKKYFDDGGRLIYGVQNYDNFDPSTEANTGDATDKTKDRVVKLVYDSVGNKTEYIALDLDGDGSLSDNQTTKYLYESEYNASSLTNEIYPDSSDTTSSGTDQIKFEFDLAGQLTKQTDQNGTVLEFTYNNIRLPELTKVTTLGTGVDGHVRSRKNSYDSLNRIEKISTYSNSDGTGTIRNEIQNEYDDLGKITAIYQSHEGAVNTSTTPKVSYSYDTTATSNVFDREHRLEKVTYPDGRSIFYDFDTSSGNDGYFNRLSNVRHIRETSSAGTILSTYDYKSEGGVVMVDLPEPDLKLDYYQGTSGEYAALDRFGRVEEQYWTGYNSTSDVDQLHFSFDYAGNQTSRDIDSSIYSSNDKDQVYTLDNLNRLTAYDEGTLSGSSISGTPAQEKEWTLDTLGNWSNYVEKTSGTTDLNQSRTVNDVNEITDITETTGSSWVTPAYDAIGSMTTVPQPNSPTNSYTATYDAWGRLVKLVDGANTVVEYEYDALHRPIVKSVYSSGTLDHKRHNYYNGSWQILEVRKETGGTEDTDPLEQYVWHPYYTDALILRDYDADTDGTSVRHYYTQDKNYNVLSVLDDSGTVLERYHYTPHGTREVLDADFSADADGISDIDNVIGFTGQRYQSETGLYAFRNRMYSPLTGNFISRDQKRYVDGMSMYAAYFVPGGLDPSGNQWSFGRPIRKWNPITIPYRDSYATLNFTRPLEWAMYPWKYAKLHGSSRAPDRQAITFTWAGKDPSTGAFPVNCNAYKTTGQIDNHVQCPGWVVKCTVTHKAFIFLDFDVIEEQYDHPDNPWSSSLDFGNYLWGIYGHETMHYDLGVEEAKSVTQDIHDELIQAHNNEPGGFFGYIPSEAENAGFTPDNPALNAEQRANSLARETEQKWRRKYRTRMAGATAHTHANGFTRSPDEDTGDPNPYFPSGLFLMPEQSDPPSYMRNARIQLYGL